MSTDRHGNEHRSWEVDREEKMQRALESILREPHHWCTKGQTTDKGYLTCSCGKDNRDRKIKAALRGVL